MLTGCSGCGSRDLREFLVARDERGSEHSIVRCRSCRLAQVKALPSPAELVAFYARYSYDCDRAWETSVATERSLDRLAQRLARHRRLGRLLDVGCGSGVLMKAMTRHGWVAEGTEISSVAVERLRAERFTVHAGSVETLQVPEGAYDVVVMSETIEHVPDPGRALGFAARTLRSGGVLFLTTPNIDSLSRRLLGGRWRAICYPDHLFYFNARSIAVLLRELRLNPTEVWTEGIDPYEIVRALRPSRPSAAANATARTEALRASVASRPAYAALKAAVNAFLRGLNLGDTLKVVAERSCGQ